MAAAAAAAAAAARLPPPPPIFLLKSQVDMGKLTDEPGGGGWTKIECASKKAYGCGEHGQEAVEGLKLYVRPGDGHLLTYSLAIRMSDKALRRFDSELELSAPSKDMPLRPIRAQGIVQMAEEEDLTVIFLLFSRPFRRNLAYYLVYDHVGASLSMIKYRADLYLPTGTMKPVPKRRGSDFELVLMTSRLQLFPTPPAVLFVCTPEARANPASDDGMGPWQMKTQREKIPGPFDPQVAFSFQGKGFWADLSRGLVHCDLHTTSDTAVDFGFITLPREFLEQMEQMEPEELKLYGTMACVRDSIWLVCIHNAAECADDLVKIWTLNVPGGKWQKARWEKVQEVPVSVLWGLDSFKEAGLPQGPFEGPILTPDGALCVTLPDFNRCHFMPTVDPVCIFKVRGEMGLLWHGVVHDNFSYPVICPSNFLQMKHGSKWKHGSSETKVDEHRPAAAGLAALAAAESKQRVD